MQTTNKRFISIIITSLLLISAASAMGLKSASATPISEDGFEQNDTMATAANITTGWTYNLCQGDEDWYVIDVPENYSIDVFIEFNGTIDDIDFEISDQNSMVINGSYGIGDTEETLAYNKENMTSPMYIHVWGYDNNESYNMNINIFEDFAVLCPEYLNIQKGDQLLLEWLPVLPSNETESYAELIVNWNYTNATNWGSYSRNTPITGDFSSYINSSNTDYYFTMRIWTVSGKSVEGTIDVWVADPPKLWLDYNSYTEIYFGDSLWLNWTAHLDANETENYCELIVNYDYNNSINYGGYTRDMPVVDELGSYINSSNTYYDFTMRFWTMSGYSDEGTIQVWVMDNDDSYEENDNWNTSIMIDNNTYYSSLINHDDDFYSFYLSSGAVADITVWCNSGNSMTLKDVNPYDGSIIQTDSSSADGLLYLQIHASGDGMFCIGVFGDNLNSIYDLQISSYQNGDDSYEENDDIDNASYVGFGFYGDLYQYDQDWYAVWVNTGETIGVELTANFSETYFSIDLYLDGSNYLTGVSDDGFSCYVEWTNYDADGHYIYIEINGNNMGVNYGLNIQNPNSDDQFEDNDYWDQWAWLDTPNDWNSLTNWDDDYFRFNVN
ncbi:MAG: hypothetical protein ACTSVU_06930, partial [Promethearchaeota archaeon]